MEKNKREKKEGKKKRRGVEYGCRTRELRLDSLMVSPPTPQRHELALVTTQTSNYFTKH